MVWRFTVRPTGDGSDRFGVWDGAVHGWRANDLTELDAHQVASELEIQYDAHGPRSGDAVRRVDPARQVQRAEWHSAGVLDVWIHDNGEWLGRVREPDGRISWVRAGDLRPENAP
jgi:hypothetical protein